MSSLTLCCALKVVIERVGDAQACPPRYRVTVCDAHRRYKRVARVAVRVEAADPTLTEFQLCRVGTVLPATPSTRVERVRNVGGVLSFDFVQSAAAAKCEAADKNATASVLSVELIAHTVNVSPFAPRETMLRAYVDAVDVVEGRCVSAAATAHGGLTYNNNICYPLASAPLCTDVDVTDGACYDASAPQRNVVYVKATGTNTAQTGASWDTAFLGGTGLFMALQDASASGDQVWVQVGTYEIPPNTPLQVKEGVKVFGGFAGTERLLCERCVFRATTTTDANLLVHSVVVATSPASTSFTLASNTILDGFVVSGFTNNVSIDIAAKNVVVRHVLALANTASTGSAFLVAANAQTTMCDISARVNAGTALDAMTGSNIVVHGAVLVENNRGIVVRTTANVVVSDALVANNEFIGVDVLESPALVSLINCTVIGNGTTDLRTVDATTTSVQNSIVGNVGNNGTLALIDSLLTGSVGGTGTVQQIRVKTGDAGFVNIAAGDYHLRANSKAVDCGDNDVVVAHASVADADGLPRIVGPRVDLGAYERQAPSVCPPLLPSPHD